MWLEHLPPDIQEVFQPLKQSFAQSRGLKTEKSDARCGASSDVSKLSTQTARFDLRLGECDRRSIEMDTIETAPGLAATGFRSGGANVCTVVLKQSHALAVR